MRLYQVDKAARQERRRKPVTRQKRHGHTNADGESGVLARDVTTTAEEAEARLFVASLARNFAASIEFYKTEAGGELSHEEAAASVVACEGQRLKWVNDKDAKGVTWSDLSTVGRASVADALALWARIRDAADDALMTGERAAGIAGALTPYERAEFLAIRDAFADQWKPRGGIESAMIDQLTVAFSLQMYWTAIAHERAVQEHDRQEKEIRRFDSMGWKSPYQSRADAIEQAHRLADSYNRQFLRVLRQLRDLRRYAPPVIVNNGGQVNVAANGGQQVNVAGERKELI